MKNLIEKEKEIFGKVVVIIMFFAIAYTAYFYNDTFAISLKEVLESKQEEISELCINMEEQSENDLKYNSSINSSNIIECESIVQGVIENNIADGNYIFKVNGKIGDTVEEKQYPVEIINYYDDVTYTNSDNNVISLGDDSTDYKMLIVKYHKNLYIEEGVTVTANTVDGLTYKKGMYICVLGELENKGTISMTARGTYNIEGENVYLWKHINQESYQFIPAVGASGGISQSTSEHSKVLNGKDGFNGKNRGTGGGRNRCWTKLGTFNYNC